jgi:tryptophan synthase alpha chain
MKRSLIAEAFKKCKKEKRPALLTYTVAGDNTKRKSLEILKKISSSVDIVELGLPHNTPIADGGQIQNSTFRSLKNGMKTKDIFQIVKSYKKFSLAKPLIIMTYYNPILQYGEKKFLKDCKRNGVNGLIVVDLPWPENKNFAKKCKKKSISFIQLLSPTTSKIRMKKIIKDSHEMCYYISMLSTTGGKLKVSPKKILENYNKIKRINKSKNLVIGFGITKKTISSLKKADGLVVGSQLCKGITDSIKNHENPVIKLNKMVKSLKSKIQ